VVKEILKKKQKKETVSNGYDNNINNLQNKSIGEKRGSKKKTRNRCTYIITNNH